MTEKRVSVSKDSNPKTSVGDTKVPLHLFPSTAIAAGASRYKMLHSRPNQLCRGGNTGH